MDLGVLLARRHMGLLMASWALITLPVFLLLSLLLWNYSGWAMFVFWLLKPAFERLPLYILSRALFGDTPTLKEALKAYPRLLATADRQPHLAPLQPLAQLRHAGDATRRPLRRSPQPAPGGPRPARCRRRHLAHHHRHAPGNRPVDGPDHPPLPDAAAAGGGRLGLAETAGAGRRRLGVDGAPVQQPVFLRAHGLGTGLRRLRLHPLPEPPHCTRGLGHRTGVPPPAPAPDRPRLRPGAGHGRGPGDHPARPAGAGRRRRQQLPAPGRRPQRPRRPAPHPPGTEQPGRQREHRQAARRAPSRTARR